MNTLRTTMLLAALTALFMGLGYLIGGTGGALIALVIAAGMNLFTYWNADKIVLRMHNAVEVDAASAPQLYGIVEELARRGGLPTPRVYLIDEPHPNAFATGRNPQNAAVAATIGMSTPIASAARFSTGAVDAPSATVRRSASSSAGRAPSPIPLPSEKLRELVEEQVRTRSPSPASPASVSARAPLARPKRVISAKPREISAARAFWPSPRPSTTPQAMASTFLTAPPTSAPATSSLR